MKQIGFGSYNTAAVGSLYCPGHLLIVEEVCEEHSSSHCDYNYVSELFLFVT